MRFCSFALQAVLFCLVLTWTGYQVPAEQGSKSSPVDEKTKEEATEINGVVKLDGKPIGAGTITFIPDKKTAPAVGGIIKDGSYAVKARPGRMRVEISAPTAGKDPVVEALPAKYNVKSVLRAEIVPGKNKLDFELRSK